MHKSPFRYPYLESEVTAGLSEGNPIYQIPPQLADWVESELEKRALELRAQEGHQDVKVYLTLRNFKKYPVFLMAYPTEDKKTVLEGWHFRIIPSEEHPERAMNLVLDRVPLKRLFKDLETSNPE